MAFCKSCGNQLGNEAVFCSKCGTRKTAVQNNTIENARMVLNVTKKDGAFSCASCFYVFFNDRIVISVLTKEIQDRENKLLSERIKAEGKGFFKGSAEMMSYWSNYGNRFYQMSHEQILYENPSNILIYNSQISRITFVSKDRKNMHDTSDYNRTTYGDLIIEHANGKIKASHNYSDSNKSIKEVLERLFYDRLKYKGGGLAIHIGGNKQGFI